MSRQQNSGDAKIQQMINFIKSEAQEKAQEIEVSTREEFVVEKQNLVEEAKKKINSDYEKKKQQVIVKKKIDHSNEIKAARLEILKLKEEALKEIVKEATERIKSTVNNRELYSKLLHDLMLQGVLRLLDEEVTVLCREQDYDLVQSQVSKVEADYAKQSGMKVKITVPKNNFLPKDSVGGVIISTLNNLIKIDNTLEKRVALCREQKLPVLREMLYGDLKQHKI
ncbi:hypothetical protein ABK040_014363 [Willaertia magna]